MHNPLHVCLGMRPFACMSVCLGMRPFACMSACLGMCPFACMSVCLGVCRFACISVCLPYPYVFLCLYVSVLWYVFLCLYVSVSVCLLVLAANAVQIEKGKELIKKVQFAFRSESFENPALQKHYANVEAMALERDAPEEISDFTRT